MSQARERSIPRLVVAGAASGVGKTTTVVALAGAARARGLAVVTFKCGPDYLDPTYHARVTGTPSHNLDGWMMGREAVRATFLRATQGADLAIVEGVMGLYDGAAPTSEEGSTAEIAKWLAAPVVACIDASGMARTFAAVARGLAVFDPDVQLAGALATHVGSRGHLDLLRAASERPPVVGGLPRRPDLAFPERHLGLFHAGPEHVPRSTLDAWAALAEEWLDIDALLALARSAPPLAEQVIAPAPRAITCPVRIAIARDEAFHFYYDENLAALEAHGAELAPFSPIHDERLPEADGVLIGGGYPEEHARALAANASMLDSLRAFARAGGPVYGECGGLMYLVEAIETLDGTRHPMVGLLPGTAVLRDRLQALGYVEVTTRADSILGPAGLAFRGHQFRYSELSGVAPQQLDAEHARYELRARRGGTTEAEGYAAGRVLGSYVHAHWASNPAIPAALVESCASWRTHGGAP